MALLKPGDILNDSGGPGFNPTVIAIQGLMPADRGVGVMPGFLLGREQADIIVQ